MNLSRLVVIAACVLSACTSASKSTYDLVIAGGRVIDPESKLDGVRNIGIRGGRIEAISEQPLTGARDHRCEKG
jgi:N-acyl-D-aspartate/D-glutamate deacylase